MDINVVRARLAGTAGALEILQDTQGAVDLRALLADHARLNELLGNSEQLAPAIDLEQVRMLAQGSVDALAQNKVYPADVSAAIGSMRHLLALIDGQADPRVDLAADHTGMRVDYSGLIGSAQRALLDDPGISEMLRQLCRHLEELGRRWYAGDRKVVDEFLQLYCIESEARAALVKQPTKGEGE